MMKFIFISSFILSISAWTQVSRISILSDNPPANDLILKGEVISSKQAKSLSKTFDLSELNPKENGTWLSKKLKIKKSSLTPVKSVEFLGHLTSINLFRFSAVSDDGELRTYYLDKLLHTTILRKNFLTKLGYVFPEMAHQKKLIVNFSSELQKEKFKKKIRLDTQAASTRWIVKDQETATSLTLRDLAQIELTGKDLPNVLWGVPPQDPDDPSRGVLRSRTQRAVVLAYSILDLKESANKFHWHVCREAEGAIELPHFYEFNNFQSTDYSDLQWIGRKIKSLNRADIKEIVQKTAMPLAVQGIIYHKLLSRIQSALKCVGLLDSATKKKFAFKEQPSATPYLIKGKIIKEKWYDEGYATNFASPVQSGPFSETKWYLYALGQSLAIDNIIGLFNNQLQAFDPNDAKVKKIEEVFEFNREQFVQSGDTKFLTEFPVSTWRSPVLGGDLIVSRDVVVGNYLGTDNLVQVADTFGFAIRPGMITGLEFLKNVNNTVFRGGVNYIKTWTHIKPLTSIKTVFEQNYKNIVVPLFKKDISKTLEKVKEINDHDTIEKLQKKLLDPKAENIDEITGQIESKQEEINKVFKEFSSQLGNGESLLITERIVPYLGGQTVVPLGPSNFSLRVGLQAQHIGLKRTQIYRKDANTIQIYEDKGNGFGMTFSLELRNLIPILRFEQESRWGNFGIKLYTLDLNASLDENPDIYQNLLVLNDVVKSNNTEVLEEVAPPIKLKAKFSDKYNRTSILFWKRQRFRGFTDYSIDTPSGLNGKFCTYYDSINNGFNYESFLKEIINFQLSERSENITWANNVWQNPDDSILGAKQLKDITYEAQIKNDKIQKEFLDFKIGYAGWSKSEKKIIKAVKKINKKFSKNLFDVKSLKKIGTHQLYDISAHIILYDQAIKNLKKITPDALIRIAYPLEKKKFDRCKKYMTLRTLKDGKKIPTCGLLGKAIRLKKKCDSIENISSNSKEISKCYPKFFKALYEDLEIKSLLTLIGKENTFIQGTIDGFRTKSEVLRETIYSNSFGERHPKYPYGILNNIQKRVGLNNGEFTGQWLREMP